MDVPIISKSVNEEEIIAALRVAYHKSLMEREETKYQTCLRRRNPLLKHGKSKELFKCFSYFKTMIECKQTMYKF